MHNFSKTYYGNLTKKQHKTIYELRDENYNTIEDIIYEKVGETHDFPHGLEKIIEKQLNDEETLFNILLEMEIIDECGDEIVEEEEDDNE